MAAGAFRCGFPFTGKPHIGRWRRARGWGGYLHFRRLLGLKWVSPWGSFKWSLECSEVFVLPSLMRCLSPLSKHDTCSFEHNRSISNICGSSSELNIKSLMLMAFLNQVKQTNLKAKCEEQAMERGAGWIKGRPRAFHDVIAKGRSPPRSELGGCL